MIQGVGESIRGTVGAAIDRSFKDYEGARKNEDIAREGEYEVQSGRLAASTKEREGFDGSRR